MSYTVGDGRVEFIKTGTRVQVIPAELGELRLLRDYEDLDVLGELAQRFRQIDFEPGQELTSFGSPCDQVFLLAHGRIDQIGPGPYGEDAVLGTVADGAHFGEYSLVDEAAIWEYTARAATSGTALVLSRQDFQLLADRVDSLREHVGNVTTQPARHANTYGEAAIELSASTTRARPCSPAPSWTTRPARASTNSPLHKRSCGCTRASPTSTTSR